MSEGIEHIPGGVKREQSMHIIGGVKREFGTSQVGRSESRAQQVVLVGVVVVVGQTVGSISRKTLAYDCLCTLKLCMASKICYQLLGHLGDYLHSISPSYS